MAKIKKIVAAVIAALSMGAIAITASASVNAWTDFELDFEALEENVYSQSARKSNSFANDAAVTVHDGAIIRKPVEFSVWNTADELYGESLTDYVKVAANGVTKEMPYYESGYPGTHESFYLHAYSLYNMNLEGRWTP